jgi:hypothetical protein
VSHTLKDLGLVDVQSPDRTDSQSHLPAPRFRVGHAELLLTFDWDNELPRFEVVDVIGLGRSFFAAFQLTVRKTIA